MPIPDVGISGLLPPLLAEDGRAYGFSPFNCSVQELCERFGHTAERKAILKGFLDFRAECRRHGVNGFQWVAGSFVEDVEAMEGRPPNDIDVVTFIGSPDTTASVEALKAAQPHLFSRVEMKERYGVDHLAVPLKSPPSTLVKSTCYWYALYSHNERRAWKGLLRVELSDETDDLEARKFLAGGS